MPAQYVNSMRREIQAEILDDLPSNNKDAIASRRDLVKINTLMGNYRWISSATHRSQPQIAKRYIEIGAGDGTLAKRLLKKYPSLQLDVIDRSTQPASWPATAAWIQQDLLAFKHYDQYTDLIANLILHHFDQKALHKLGLLIRKSGIQRIYSCEPCRRRAHQWQLTAGKLIGFNHVTLHDGHVSVAAGFRHNELPQLIGLSKSEWNWEITETLMGSYRMQAERK